MKRKTKSWLVSILGIFLLLILYIVFLFDWNLLKGFVQNEASSSTGRKIEINGDIDVGFSFDLSPEVRMQKVSISNMQSGTEPQMLVADKVNFEFNLLSPLYKRLRFPSINVENAKLVLEKDKDGNANWLFGEKDDNKEVNAPKIGKLYIKNTTFIYRDPQKGTDVNVVVNSGRDFRKQGNEAEQDFVNVKGEGTYKKGKFIIDFYGASVLDLEKRRKPYPLKANAKIGSTEINVEGTIVDPNELKGMDLTLNVKGENAADIFPIFGIALLPTPPYSVTGKLNLTGKDWKFENFAGHMGSSDVKGNLTWSLAKERPMLTAKFVSDNLNFKDMGAFIGATPKQKEVAKETSPYVIPDVPLDISRLSAMDANVEFIGKKVTSANLPLDDFYMKLELNDKFLKINPVKFGTANGDITAIMEINARKAPVEISGDFQFKKLSLNRLLAAAPSDDKNNQGFIGGTAKLKGHGKSLREMVSSADGKIGIGMEGGKISNLLVELIGLDIAESLGFLLSGDKPVPIRCIVGDFGVKSGLMSSNILVIDTADTNITGKGTINLDNEKMDIKLYPKPKDQSILSLKSPITISGTLKNPDFNIASKELIAKSAAAATVSVFLTPIVGALAFIEPGLGKDSNCAKLIGQMNKDVGKTAATSMVPKNKK